MLRRQGDIEVVGQAGSGREAFDMARKLRPDLILLDMSMPDGGMQALREIKMLEDPPIVAMLTVSENEDLVIEAIRLGADGYILKGIGGRSLMSGIRELLAGRPYMSSDLAGKILKAREKKGHAA
ncbi:response regulator transcription factor [Paracoccus litorisediminis]|uniref:response regulator n=1 Tax=Paracoccus litorisediminis TaxID=2006130 RepID=UPI003732A68A